MYPNAYIFNLIYLEITSDSSSPGANEVNRTSDHVAVPYNL